MIRLQDAPASVESRGGDWAEMDAQKSMRRFVKTFERLTRDQREALVGRRVEGLTLRELAVRMGKTETAVAMLIERAVKRLRLSLRAGDAGE